MTISVLSIITLVLGYPVFLVINECPFLNLSTDQSVYLQEVSSPGQELTVSKITQTAKALLLL